METALGTWAPIINQEISFERSGVGLGGAPGEVHRLVSNGSNEIRGCRGCP